MESKKEKKGCVYFFKHIGLSPIKIGFTLQESPIVRFIQFKTYAPFGAQILGFIKTYSPMELEKLLHDKFSSYRLTGEWFEIDENIALKTIDFYSNIEDVEERNRFQIEWAKYNDTSKKDDDNIDYNAMYLKKIFTNDKCGIDDVMNMNEIKIEFEKIYTDKNISKKEIRKYFNNLGLQYKTFRVSNGSKKGYKVRLN